MTKCISVDYVKNRITSKFLLDLILWLAVAAPMTYLLVAGQPRVRGFFCDDNTIKYPDKRDSVPTTLLVIIGFTVFFLVLILVELLNCIDRRCSQTCLTSDSIINCVKAYLLLMFGFVCQHLLVQIVKQQTGVLRPNFLDVCRPTFNQTLCDKYISEYTCTNDDLGAIKDTRESFPSGHAAFSMYMAVYLSIYIQRRLHIHFSRILKPLLQFGLVFLSLICGQGRIVDNKHHMSDVIAGHIVGVSMAVAVFRTLGFKYLKPSYISESKPDPLTIQTEDADCCCACADPESDAAQTPSSLLQNEYTSVNTQETTMSVEKDFALNGKTHNGNMCDKS